MQIAQSITYFFPSVFFIIGKIVLDIEVKNKYINYIDSESYQAGLLGLTREKNIIVIKLEIGKIVLDIEVKNKYIK